MVIWSWWWWLSWGQRFELILYRFTIFQKEALYLITLIGIDNANVGKGKVPASPRFLNRALPLTRTGAIGDADAVADLN